MKLAAFFQGYKCPEMIKTTWKHFWFVIYVLLTCYSEKRNYISAGDIIITFLALDSCTMARRH
jgi:hypothetical protein